MLQRPVVEIAPRTWLLSEYKLVNMYLLEGDTHALLIDCGTGIGDIPAEIRKLTDKPVIVVITHGHPDHDGAAAQFDAVYMHPLDIPLSENMYDSAPQFRERYVRSRVPVRNPGADADEIVALIQPNGTVTRLPVEDGYVFDLGGRHVEVIHTPGHSLGSICLLDKENRLLFNGDTCNGESLLLNIGPSCSTMEEYHEAMKRLWAREGEFDYILWGHDNLEKCDKTIIEDYIEASGKLVSGEIQGEKGGDAMHAGFGCRYKRVLIWYDPDRLVKK